MSLYDALRERAEKHRDASVRYRAGSPLYAENVRMAEIYENAMIELRQGHLDLDLHHAAQRSNRGRTDAIRTAR